MADWRVIDDDEVQPDAPLTSSLAFAWRDNPIAIAEGATGAPKVQRDAMGSWAGSSGGVYTLAFASWIGGSLGDSVTFGQVVSGSTLRPAPASGSSTGTALSGNWRCLGIATNTGSATNAPFDRTTLWVRIS